jgi:DNA-binding beta-propeller fold protein YncE
MVLKLIHTLDLPSHPSGGFDHGDVFEKSGLSFVAHTGNGTVEIYEGREGVHLKTVSGVPGASGVLCAQAEKIVLAASRGAGKVLVLDGVTGDTIREIRVGSKPNGLAWDSRRHRLLAADVGDNHVRIVDPGDGSLIGDIPLPGRPRWCKYSSTLDRFVVNVHDPSTLAIVDPETSSVETLIPIPVVGPHGIDIDEESGFAYVACDGGAVVSVDIEKRQVLDKVEIHPNPDVAWLNVDLGLLYCANSKPGVVKVVDVKEMRIREEVLTEEGCHTVSFHQEAQTLHAYLPESCRVAFYKEY